METTRLDARVLGLSFACQLLTGFAMGEPLSLDRAIDLARENNPEIRAARWEWEMNRAEIGGAMALPEPVLSLERMEGDPAREIRLSQTLPFPLKLSARRSEAVHQFRRAGEDFRAMERHILGEVKRAYLESAYRNRVRLILQKARTDLRGMVRTLNTRGSLGRSMPTDPLKAAAEEADVEDMILMAEQDQAMAAAELALMLGDMDGDVRAAENPIPEPLSGTLAEMESEASSHSPEVLREKHHIRHAQAMVGVSRMEYFPDLMLEGFQRDDSGMRERGLMAGLSLPFLWFWGPRSMAARAGRERDHANALLTSAQLSARAHVRDSWILAQKSYERFGRYDEEFIPKSEDALRVAKEQYAAGRAGFMDLLDAWRMDLDFKLKRARALTDYGVGLSHLEELCRKELLKTGDMEGGVKP